MNKKIMLCNLEKEFGNTMTEIQTLKYLLGSALQFYKSDKDLSDRDSNTLRHEIDRLQKEITSEHGKLMAIGAACDNLRYEITEEVEGTKH